MNGCRFLIGTALLLLLTWAYHPPLILAQPPAGAPRDGRGDRGERDQFFEAMREAFRDLTPNRELMELLWHNEVRSEIGLSDAEHETIEKILRESFTQVMALRDGSAEQKLDKDAWKAKILAIQAPVDEKVMKMLADPAVADLDRLIGIYVQHRGFRSAANAEVAKRIGLEGEDFESFRRVRSELWHRLMDANRDKMSGLIREGRREKIALLFEEAERKLDRELSFRLTSAQKSELKDLEGEPFSLPRRAPDTRGRGQRGGGPGEGRNGEGRPGEGRNGEGRNSDGREGDGGPCDGPPNDGQPSDGQPNDGQPNDGDSRERGGRPGPGPKRGQSPCEQACRNLALRVKAGA